jgi:hypothetical protein
MEWLSVQVIPAYEAKELAKTSAIVNTLPDACITAS